MKKDVLAQKQNFAWLKGFLLMCLLVSVTNGFSAPPAVQQQSCIIASLQKTLPYQGAVTYNWSAVSGATEYKIFYVRLSDNYVSPVTSTGATSATFSGLQAGSYRFFFAPVCGDNPLEYIADDLILI